MDHPQENQNQSDEDAPKSFLASIFSNSKVQEAEELAQTRMAVAGLKQQNDELTAALADSKESLALAEQKLADIGAQFDALAAENSDLQAKLEKHLELNPNSESIQAAAARAAAQNHVENSDDLPAGGSSEESDVPSSVEELEAELKNLKTHAEKSALVKKFNARRAA